MPDKSEVDVIRIKAMDIVVIELQDENGGWLAMMLTSPKEWRVVGYSKEATIGLLVLAIDSARKGE